ncbi:hypothetical protein CR513_25489, partial [Mucuna pruriens]
MTSSLNPLTTKTEFISTPHGRATLSNLSSPKPSTPRIEDLNMATFVWKYWHFRGGFIPICGYIKEWGPILGPVCIGSEECVVVPILEKPNFESDNGAISMSSYQTSNHSATGWHKAFERKHGNLLSILDIEVQPVTLEVLAQYYDPPLLCFTFKDF